ncbi:two-component sensor histidine kinase [Synechococcus sp. RSCCF101]|uniref:ATP-binding protein n=1 Tax=Synechococcus sp. RSCCF101 TaxID=2511069 RepID=UPI0012491181|nr:ATP-binding protein [Synechococcus sp. RSCCF101]QEY31858.1 two-component sensor histidine kinase [Synechococcus sp. RSCCF101]
MSRLPWRWLLLGRLIGAFAGSSLASLLVFQQVFAQQIERLQTAQLGRGLALTVRLSELALERFPPPLVSELTGLRLIVQPVPGGMARSILNPRAGPASLRRQGLALQGELCRRLSHCPAIQMAQGPERGVWIELISPLEPVWLFAALRSPVSWPPAPLLLSLALVSGATISGAAFLLLEVEQPLRALERALGRVGRSGRQPAVEETGAPDVRRLTRHFNAMLARLEATQQERATMLAGIAHDLRSPITRLRFRLSLLAAPVSGADRVAEIRERGERDLDALERITSQFLLFAGGGEHEAAVEVPLDALLAEALAQHDPGAVRLELRALTARVQPIAMARAVANLVDNALAHGTPPVVVRLIEGEEGGFAIQVWDQGEGISAEAWERALQPFQRLDQARGGQGHCGLGMAIAARVARWHGGELRRLQQPGADGRFAVALVGRSLASAGPT